MVVSQSQVSDSISFIFLGCVGHWFWPQPTVDVVESILYICVPWLDFSDRNIFQHRVLFFKRFLLTKILQIRLEFSLTSHPLYIVLCPSASVTSYIFSTARCFKPNKQWKQIENFPLKLPFKNVLQTCHLKISHQKFSILGPLINLVTQISPVSLLPLYVDIAGSGNPLYAADSGKKSSIGLIFFGKMNSSTYEGAKAYWKWPKTGKASLKTSFFYAFPKWASSKSGIP